MTLLLRKVTLGDTTTADVRIDGDRIAAVAASITPEPGEEVLDLAGYVLLPAAVEPHAHLDKAFLADRVPNPKGDLVRAIEAIHAAYESITIDDIAERAERAARISLTNGITAIRTHVDVNMGNGLRSVEALLRVRATLKDLVDIQIVALIGPPLVGRDGADNRALLRDALDAGVDVVGGCPQFDPDHDGSLDYLLETAGHLGRPLDLHTDETLDPTLLGLRLLARRVMESEFRAGTVASHCVSLGMQSIDVQRAVAEQVAAAGVAVVALPQTNLFLQARGVVVGAPRGLTAVRPLLDAGVMVAAGADNLQDPFNTMGRADPFETAALMVMAGHATPDEAYTMVSTASRAALGLEAVEVVPGAPAELLAVEAPTLRGAIAFAPAARVVIHRGRVVSRTVLTSTTSCMG
ncbi:MAG: amidohydrolase family protein [Acidimicrobiales bacterium]